MNQSPSPENREIRLERVKGNEIDILHAVVFLLTKRAVNQTPSFLFKLNAVVSLKINRRSGVAESHNIHRRSDLLEWVHLSIYEIVREIHRSFTLLLQIHC